MYRFGIEENAALPTAGRYRKSRFSKDLQQVELTGIEPATSCLQSRRSPN
jgi:hypothetical protein